MAKFGRANRGAFCRASRGAFGTCIVNDPEMTSELTVPTSYSFDLPDDLCGYRIFDGVTMGLSAEITIPLDSITISGQASSYFLRMALGNLKGSYRLYQIQKVYTPSHTNFTNVTKSPGVGMGNSGTYLDVSGSSGVYESGINLSGGGNLELAPNIDQTVRGLAVVGEAGSGGTRYLIATYDFTTPIVQSGSGDGDEYRYGLGAQIGSPPPPASARAENTMHTVL